VTLPLLTEAELGTMLSGFTASARRFEIRDRYNSDVGREAFRRFLAGEPDDYGWHRSWLDKLRQDHAVDKQWQRIRIVSTPLSDYTRYGLVVGRLNVAAGEDIRYLTRDGATDLGLDPYDAWLLDDDQLVRLHFNDADDTFRGAQLITDREVVDRHRQWWPLAWRHAQPLDEFAATYL
jgi:hypothetical protein